MPALPDSIQEATSKQILLIQSKIDSIQLKNNILVDSLQSLTLKVKGMEEIVNKTEIGQGYFSDLLTTQVTLFGLIVGLIGLGSIGVVFTFVKLEVKKVEKKLSEFENSIEEEIDEIYEVNIINRIQAVKTLFFINSDSQRRRATLIWGLRFLKLIIEHERTTKSFNLYTKLMTQALPGIRYSSISSQKETEIKELFMFFRNNDNPDYLEIKNEVSKIEDLFYKNHYANK